MDEKIQLVIKVLKKYETNLPDEKITEIANAILVAIDDIEIIKRNKRQEEYDKICDLCAKSYYTKLKLYDDWDIMHNNLTDKNHQYVDECNKSCSVFETTKEIRELYYKEVMKYNEYIRKKQSYGYS